MVGSTPDEERLRSRDANAAPRLARGTMMTSESSPGAWPVDEPSYVHLGYEDTSPLA